MPRKLLLPLLLVAACRSTGESKPTPPPEIRRGDPIPGWPVALYEIRDAYDRQRLGLLKTYRYEGGAVLHWVVDVDDEVRLGYIAENGMATKLVWSPGALRADHQQIGIDTRVVGARRILGYKDDVILRPITAEQLYAELFAGKEGGDTAGE